MRCSFEPRCFVSLGGDATGVGDKLSSADLLLLLCFEALPLEDDDDDDDDDDEDFVVALLNAGCTSKLAYPLHWFAAACSATRALMSRQAALPRVGKSLISDDNASQNRYSAVIQHCKRI
jgi:hypothetical protein